MNTKIIKRDKKKWKDKIREWKIKKNEREEKKQNMRKRINKN
jgi:hypothetical protein